MESMKVDLNDGIGRLEGFQTNIFDGDDIVYVSDRTLLDSFCILGRDVDLFTSQNQRHLISCKYEGVTDVALAATMLMLDRGVDYKHIKLIFKEITHFSMVIEELVSAGVYVDTVHMLGGGIGGLLEVSKMIKSGGAAIISIKTEQRGVLYLIVDKIDFNLGLARIRDPSSASEMIIRLEFLSRSFVGGEIIQARRHRLYPQNFNIKSYLPKVCYRHKVDLFKEEDIAKVFNIAYEEEYEEGFFVYYTGNKKALIQEQAIQGSFAAAASMLLLDKDMIPNYAYLFKSGNENFIHEMLTNFDLHIEDIHYSCDLDYLTGIVERGSVIAILNGQGGSKHAVLLDSIFDNRVRLRDPHHGWEIEVYFKSFLRLLRHGKIIRSMQIEI